MNKVIRFELVPKAQEGKTQADAYHVLHKIQRECMEVANKTVQLAWEWHNYGSDYKRDNGGYPDKTVEQSLFGKTFQSYAYNQVRAYAPDVYSESTCCIVRDVCGKFNKEKREYLLGTRSIASYKSNYPLPVGKKNIDIRYFKKYVDGKKVDEYYVLDIPIFSRDGLATFDVPETHMQFKMYVGSGSQKAFLKDCTNVTHYTDIDGVITKEKATEDFKPRYAVTQSNLAYDERKKKYYFNLGYSFEAEKVEFVPGRAVGVQVGVNVPLFCAINDKRDTFCIDECEIEEFRKRTEARRIALMRQTKYCGDGRIGHGRKKRTEPQMKIGDKVANFRDTCNHKYSRAVVEFAKRNKAEKIIIEDLTGISEDNLFLKTWSYYDLQQKIKSKAEECGIIVETIDPQYTSRRCTACGNINTNEDNVKEHRMFVCEKCGFRTKFDHNAAINIATPDITNIIGRQVTVQELNAPLPKKPRTKKAVSKKSA